MAFVNLVLILTILKSLVTCQQVNFEDCGSGNVKSVKLIPCDKPESCSLLVNTFSEVEIEFTATDDADQVSELIKGIVRGKELPFPGEKINPCDGHLTPGCPLKKDQTYKFTAKFEIKQFYPAIPIQIKYSLLDKSENILICIKAGAIIVSNSPKKPRRGRGGS